ncbi:hypothetical protein ABE29_24785 [Cytobacillus firmus]|nr:hypothetical protein [Cytobacillus firmus]MBG9552394.1 hypothetical protein [Cytobacillus firmus]MBG9558261.1 hypothetical protein [Cytobacillus firmus]MBG9577399.1 hypothetical protein [Cytobacillus firmus]MBG9601686.1 hypothetical protein [Cytobacillus firmus]
MCEAFNFSGNLLINFNAGWDIRQKYRVCYEFSDLQIQIIEPTYKFNKLICKERAAAFSFFVSQWDKHRSFFSAFS